MSFAILGLLIASIRLQENYSDFSAFPYDGYVAEGAEGVHDPAVLEFHGVYLSFQTGPGIGFLRTSKDLFHWKVEGAVMPNRPSWLASMVPHDSIWAPEAKPFGDGLRMYYCASARFGHNDSCIGVADCPKFNPTNPKTGWIDRGMVIQSKDGVDNFNAIDPDVLTDGSGRQWMFFGSYWSGIYVAEIDPATGKLKDNSPAGKTLVARNPADRANGLEAPCCVQHGDDYYLFVNYGLAAQGVSSTYRIEVGRSKSPSGPFLDQNGVSMVDGGHLELMNSSSPMFGPGGGVEFKDDSGRWLMSYHYYDGRKNWHDHVWGLPTLAVRELLWSPDGWPLPGLPITPETESLESKSQSSPEGKWQHQANYGRVQTLDIRRDGTCVLDGRDRGTWKTVADGLEFDWPKSGSPGEFWVDKVQFANKGNYLVGRNQSFEVVRAVRDN